MSRGQLTIPVIRHRNPLCRGKWNATPPQSANSGILSNGSSTWPSVFFNPNATRMIPATIQM